MRGKPSRNLLQIVGLCAAAMVAIAAPGRAQVNPLGAAGAPTSGYAGSGAYGGAAGTGVPLGHGGQLTAFGPGAQTGVALSPSGVNVSGLSGAVARLSPQQVNAAMQALGISPNEALLLQQQLATGVISGQEVQSLCAHLAASNISPALVQSVAGTIGLNTMQLQQVQACLPGGSAATQGSPQLGMGGAHLGFGMQTVPGIPQSGLTTPPAPHFGMFQPGTAAPSFGAAVLPQPGMPAPGIAPMPAAVPQAAVANPAGAPLSQLSATPMAAQPATSTVPLPQSSGQPMQTGLTQPNASPLVAAAPTAPPSLIEQNYGQLDLQIPPPNPSPVSLSQFGYSIFASAVSSFAPLGNIPVGPDYVLGPGDQLNIYMWGRINQNMTVMVDRDGSVEVSGIEPLQVGGLSFEAARKLIEGRVSQISNVSVHVTMGPLRTLQVMVVGAVNQPGSYTVSPMARVSAALIAAGGVAKIGSLRAIELRRANRVLKRIDFYKLLLKGDNGDDPFLQTNDVIFVPPIGPVVGVAGDVQRPAIYELRSGGAEVRAALALAAGASPFADTERVQVERIDQRRRLVVLDLPYAELEGRHFALHDGDLVKVFHMLTMHHDVVELTGNVRRPGEFQWHPNLRLSDLVAMGGGVAERTSFKYALLRRMTHPSMRQRLIQMDLRQALLGPPHSSADLTLEPLDEVDIFNEDALREAPVAGVTGEVQLPGTYALAPGMKLSDLVYMAGGLRDDADFSRIQIDRTQIVDGAKARYVRLFGNLRKTPGHPLDDPLLMKNDQVYITVATGYHPPWTVVVSGEVMRPGTYPIHRDERLSALLLGSGGFTSGAFPRGIIFTRLSVQQVEQDRLNQSVQQLTQGIAQFSMFAQVSGNSGPKPDTNAAMLVNLQNLLTQAQTQQATGRVVVHLDNLDQLAGSSDDVILQNGDSVTIPPTPASVSVLGSVNEPSSIAAQPGWTVRDYLYRAGGPTLYADTDSIMVVKADGSVVTQGGIKASHPFPFSTVISGGLMGVYLQAGDTIYVPADVQTFIKTQYAMSVSTIVANAAQSLGIVALVAKSL